jgi:hypothetical protein
MIDFICYTIGFVAGLFGNHGWRKALARPLWTLKCFGFCWKLKREKRLNLLALRVMPKPTLEGPDNVIRL